MKSIGWIAAGWLLLFGAQPVSAEEASKTVEGVYEERAQLAGKQVTVTGTVVKVNNHIMNRNFVHVQDGTGSEGTNNLVVTSQDTARVGDKVTITGTVVLDTDFGMGYSYPLMVEKSRVAVNQ